MLDTLADWEIGFIAAELNSKRYFKIDAPEIKLQTVGCSREPITTMGGITVIPDCTINDIAETAETVLLLPGANTWKEIKNKAVIDKASTLLSIGGTVGAICGATVALADKGLLDQRTHTSNGPGFLKMFSSNYRGESFYIDDLSVANQNLITAGSAGALLWAKQIIEHIGVFNTETLEAWYHYFSTGKTEYFYSLMSSLTIITK